MQTARIGLVCFGLALGGTTFHAQQTKPDNTRSNSADRDGKQTTAIQQSNSPNDLETTRSIRRAVVADKTLSTYAHNVKIITAEGKVTVRGPVRTDAEKRTIEAKAAEVAGAANVVSEISVVPTKSTKK